MDSVSGNYVFCFLYHQDLVVVFLLWRSGNESSVRRLYIDVSYGGMLLL